MKKLLCGVLMLAMSACSQASFNQGLANMTAATTAAVNLNAALVQIDVTIINNLAAQAKLLAPYACGAYAIGAQIASSPAIAAKVNAFMQKSLIASTANVAVSAICVAAGFPANVSTAPAAAN